VGGLGDVAVRATGLGKAYPLAARPRERLRQLLWGRPFEGPVHWALRELSLEVPRGGSLGVIGENGAGKSTLLALLAGLTEPTEGMVAVAGRVATLLDLGAGFNPLFTGRENVRLGGAILGLSPREVEARLPDILAFAELGDFVDRPVRTYSSGMYVRLAFALATSVDPDVLVIDEILAVGDQYFQKKCVDRIQAFRRAGVALVFCSHNLYLVKELCEQAVWLREGRVAAMGETGAVEDAYASYLRARMAPGAEAPSWSRPADSPAWLTAVRVVDGDGVPREHFLTGEALAIEVEFETATPDLPVHVGVHLVRNDAVECFATSTHFGGAVPARHGRQGAIVLRFPALPLFSGTFHVSIGLLDEHGLHPYDLRWRVCEFTVTHRGRESGFCQLEHEWRPGRLPRCPGSA
jgi:lipopolysaccharide transport system ATP-binding protein